MWNAEGKTIAQPDRVIRGLHFRCAGGIVGDASQKKPELCAKPHKHRNSFGRRLIRVWGRGVCMNPMQEGKLGE